MLVEREFEGGAAGALAGAAMGAVAGTPGAIAGAVVGAIAVVAGRAFEGADESHAAEDWELNQGSQRVRDSRTSASRRA
jgi:hypothetical protein